MPKMKLIYHEQSDWVRYVLKTKQNNDVTNRIGLV